MESQQGKLVRSLGLFSVFILVVSSVIGSGVYKKVAPMAAELRSPGWVIACWVLAGLITLCGALSNAEVAGLLADSGGEYVYYRKIYNKFFAFLFGWSSFTAIRSAGASSLAYVFAQSCQSFFLLPKLPRSWESFSVFGVFYPFENFGVKALAIALIIFLSWVNYRGLRFGEGLSRIVLYVVIGSMVLVVISGLTIGGGSLSNFQTPASGSAPHSLFDSTFMPHIFAALLAAFWAYEGWNPIGFIAGEMKNPRRDLPLALILGVAFVMLIYVLINFTYLWILPVDEIIKVHEFQNEIAAVAVVRHYLGSAGAVFISALILLTTFGATNATLIFPPRLYYAMSKEGLFFRSASFIHPQYHTPSKAILLQGIWASVLILSGSFDQLTDMLVFAAFIFYGATTLGVFILRYKMPDAPRPYKAWGYPVIPGLFVLFCATLIWQSLIAKPREAILGLTLMAAGIPFYLAWRKRSAA